MRSYREVSLVSFFVASLAFAGCDSCEKKPDAMPADAATAAMSADAAPAMSADAATAMNSAVDAGPHPMSNCPTAVPGASVAIDDAPGGVEISISSQDDATMREIRERMKKLAEADKVDAGNVQVHNHSGGGGGLTGRCTIILRNTKLTTAETPRGAKVLVEPKDKAELDWLRRETRARDVEAKSANSLGAGALRMAHCPSAVEGAKTTVKDAKDGVVVTITGPADKEAEIRTRAKHAADVAKKSDGSKVQHSGEGTGGGAIGRCPIDVEGETAVALKDIPNGVEATVTTKKDVPALQKEVKERVEIFASRK